MSISYALVALAAAQAAAPAEPLTPIQTPPAPQASAPLVVPVAPPQPVSVEQIAGPGTPIGGPHGLTLWRNIENGMPVAQLRALYSAGQDVVYKDDRTILADVPVIEGCQAKVNIMHPDGVVKEIVMRGEGSIAGRCSLKIIAALSGKYGEPLDKDKSGGSIFARHGVNYVWAHDGVTMQLKRYTSGALGGGGLFAASWELRYSSNSTNIDL